MTLGRKATPSRMILAALVLLSGCSTAPQAADSSERNIPRFVSSERCPNITDETTLEDVCDFLEHRPKDRLKAPPGARVYREIWSGPFRGPMHGGSIILTVFPDGRRTLTTPWRRDAYRLKANDLPDFESALASSDFAKLPVYNAYNGDRICVDGVATSLEAIVDGEYRAAFFSYCGGVSSESVAAALDQLFVFAAQLSGLSYPVNPDTPTFRG